ncbi:MAG TPA: glycosyltransferase [Coriobacteriia bacterium]|nr:glycosyltransferase [Coriobacteriia bacterium]
MRPHLLYVVWGYPPCRGSGVHRALATANTFAQDGWRVTVLTADRETFERFTGSDPSLEARIDPSITVTRVDFAWPAQETDIRRFSRLRAKAPSLWRRLRLIRDRIPFPEVGYGPWRRPLTRAALKIHKSDSVDLVISTANPNVTFSAAYALHRRAGIPYVMDYRDAWSLDVFSGERLHQLNSRVVRLERKYLHDATEAWFVNEPIRAWHVLQYPDVAPRMHVVANGWDPEVFAAARPDRGRPEPRTRPLTFGYLGTMSRNVPIAVLLAGWHEARDHGLVAPGSRLVIAGYLGFFATPRADIASAIAGAGDSVSYPGPIPKTEVGAFYDSIDVGVLALGTGLYVTSGKVFEYLATGKPVVSVHDPENAASSVLAGYPLWAPAQELTPSAVAAALGRGAQLAAEASEAQRSLALQFAEQYRRDVQFRPRLAELRRTVGHP